MPVKILMCPCYKDYFKEKGRSYIKHLIDFHCKCKEDDHEIFVHFCSSHLGVQQFCQLLMEAVIFRKNVFVEVNTQMLYVNTV